MRRLIYCIAIFIFGTAIGISCQKATNERTENPESTGQTVESDSLDQATGLVMDEALPIVVGNCTACHSAQLITQNRATREGWHSMIVWMQKNHKLWDLGENEAVILDYLEKHYAPEAVGRRKNLENIEWYNLN